MKAFASALMAASLIAGAAHAERREVVAPAETNVVTRSAVDVLSVRDFARAGRDTAKQLPVTLLPAGDAGHEGRGSN